MPTPQGVEWNSPTLDVDGVLGGITPASRVADVGCYGWALAAACARAGHQLIGIDRVEPPGRPATATFYSMAGTTLHMPDDAADLVVAGHVLEHMADPMALISELVRVVAPGGLVWIESPSELSALGRSSDDPTDHGFHSFWDDPTHIRPSTPGSLYRAALSFHCVPLHVSRGVAGHIPVSRVLMLKPVTLVGTPPMRFVSLKDVEPGLAAALKTWPPG